MCQDSSFAQRSYNRGAAVIGQIEPEPDRALSREQPLQVIIHTLALLLSLPKGGVDDDVARVNTPVRSLIHDLRDGRLSCRLHSP